MNRKMIDRLNYLVVFGLIDPEDFQSIKIEDNKIICGALFPLHEERLKRYPLLADHPLGWLTSTQMMNSGDGGEWVFQIDIMR